MNPNRLLTFLIIALLIVGTLVTAQPAGTSIAKNQNGKQNFAVEIEKDIQLLAQVDLRLTDVLEELNEEPDQELIEDLELELYNIARNAYTIQRRTALYLDMDPDQDMIRLNDEFILDDFDLSSAKQSDLSKLQSLRQQLGKSDDDLKETFGNPGIVPDMRVDGGERAEMLSIHYDAKNIMNEVSSILTFNNFFYGNYLDCEPHSNIKIYGNSEFTQANGVTNGSGTPNDPYIISGWEIETETDKGIDIRNTDAHFIVRGVCIHGDGQQSYGGHDGIYIYNAANGAVETSNIFNNYNGIYIRESPGIRIEGNYIYNNNDQGIFTLESPETLVSANKVSFNGDYSNGISIRLSDHSEVLDNDIKFNGENGVFIDESHSVSIRFNYVTKNSGNGIMIVRSDHGQILNNKANENDGYGITFFKNNDLTIKNNFVQLNGEKGISISSDNYDIEIRGNIICENGGGSSGGTGISTVNSKYIRIINNDISRNFGCGISIGTGCTNINIIGNEISSNVDSGGIIGISVVGSSNILIRCNNITEHHPPSSMIVVIDMDGIHLSYTSTGVTVVHNNLINNANPSFDKNPVNRWDGGYPEGGNYWSHKAGSDTKSGPNQDQPGSDGIYDYYYSFNVYDSSYRDNYPLVEPVDISECVEPWVGVLSYETFIAKLEANAKTLSRAGDHLSTSITDMYDLPDPHILKDVRSELDGIARSADSLVNRITPFLEIANISYRDQNDAARDFFSDVGNVRPTQGTVGQLRTYNDKIQKLDADVTEILKSVSLTEMILNLEFMVKLKNVYTVAAEIQQEANYYGSKFSNLLGFPTYCPEHTPILINGNSEFTAANGVRSGYGTEGQPYVIECWKINAETANGIEIRNTDVHFIIQNVYIHSGKSDNPDDIMAPPGYNGIVLRNVMNGTIDNTLLFGNENGIFIIDSSDFRISSNSILVNQNYGIYLSGSYLSRIEDNSIISNEKSGIQVIEGINVVIGKNHVQYNQGKGIICSNSQNVSISHNTVTNNDGGGILASDGSGDISIQSNLVMANGKIDDSGPGINIYFNTENVKIKDNLVLLNMGTGIILFDNVAYIHVEENIIIGNGIYGDGYFSGISASSTSRSTIIDNYISTNRGRGINIRGDSTYIQVIGNEILENKGKDDLGNIIHTGVFIGSSQHIIMKCNNIRDHGVDPSQGGTSILIGPKYTRTGVFLASESSNNFVYHNNFYNNTGRDYSGSNNWDNGYPNGGNYWDDYTGADTYSGPNQDESGSDSVGDTPYSITKSIDVTGVVQDRYPLMEPANVTECVQDFLKVMSLDSALKLLNNKLNSILSTRTQFSDVVIGMFSKTDLLTTEALRTMRDEANAIVYRITGELNDNYSCQMTELPDIQACKGNNDHKFSTQSNANKLESDTRTITMVDQRLGRHIGGVGVDRELDEIKALIALRDQANSIAVRITIQLGDDYPC